MHRGIDAREYSRQTGPNDVQRSSTIGAILEARPVYFIEKPTLEDAEVKGECACDRYDGWGDDEEAEWDLELGGIPDPAVDGSGERTMVEGKKVGKFAFMLGSTC